MTFQEFRSKRTAKFILLRILVVFAVLVGGTFPLFWFFDREYFVRNGFLGYLFMAVLFAIAIVLIPALDRLGMPADGKTKPVEKINDA